MILLINSVSHAEALHNPGLGDAGVIRQPVVAGSFYPAKRHVLEEMVDKFLMEAEPPSIEGELIALIVPHAGYIYSGSVAAFGYKLLMDKEFDIVVVIGPSHHLNFAGSSIYNVGDYLTPLGRVRVDRELCNRIIAENKRITYNRLAHLREHSLEVELPFLQRVLGDFPLIPIVMGDRSVESCVALAKALARQLKGKNALIIASSDMSHYHEYELAKLIDARTLRLIEKFSPLELLNEIASGDAQLCGGGPVVATMMTAQRLGADRMKVLKYANSGDTAGDRSRVVGYCALAFFKGGESKESMSEVGLSEEARKELLRIARKSIETYLAQGSIPEFDVAHEELNRYAGAFVTLHKFGRLRGCIGHFQADRPLYKVVAEMAIAAATKDLRFYPLTEQELPSIKLEISVLSPLKKIEDIDEIEIGKHGIYIVKGYRSGCYLPQVARETGWSKIEFLEHCSRDKAGLGPDGWKEADIYIFTAEVFGEE